MSKRRGTTQKRCSKCFINLEQCFCKHLTQIQTSTKTTIIFHLKEYFLTSNTGKISLEVLSNSDYFIRGNKEKSPLSLEVAKEYQGLYLFPSNGSVELTKELINSFEKPIHLFVPDATWSQAKKFHKREKLLSSIPHVHLANCPKSQYTLRKQNSDKGLCTIEAIAYAMGIIENIEVQEYLLKILKIMNDEVMKSRALI